MKKTYSLLAATLAVLLLLSACSPANTPSDGDTTPAEDTTTAAPADTTTAAAPEVEEPKVVQLPVPYIDIEFDGKGNIFDAMGNVDCSISNPQKGSVVNTAVKYNGQSYEIPHFQTRASGGTALLKYNNIVSSSELVTMLSEGFTMEAFLVNHTRLKSDSSEQCMISSCQSGGYNLTTYKGKYTGSVYTGGKYRNPALDSDYDTEQLSHLIFIYYASSQTATLYVNGVEVSSVDATGALGLASGIGWTTIVLGGDITGEGGTSTHCDSFEITDFKFYTSAILPSMARPMFELAEAKLTGGTLDYDVEYSYDAIKDDNAIFNNISASYVTDVYEPKTSIQSAPTILQYVTEDIVGAGIASVEKRPATVILGVSYDDGVLYATDMQGRELGELYKTVKAFEAKVIPAFIIDKTTAEPIRDFINDNRIGDCFVICEDEKLLGDICGATRAARPVLDCRGIADIEPDDVYVRASACGSKVILANMKSLDADSMLALRSRSIAVFAEPDGNGIAALHSAVFSGIAGVVTDDYMDVIEYYETFTDSDKTLSAPTLIVAHRGDPESHPDNVMSSFISAAKSGANIIELDVWLTADNHLVLNHDSTTTGFDQKLTCTKSTREQLKKLKSTSSKATSEDEIAFYDELMDYFSKNYTDMVFIVEIKDKRNEVVDKVVELTRRYGMESRVLIICMTHSIVEYAANTYGFGIQMNQSYQLDPANPVQSLAAACIECASLKTSFFTKWANANQSFSDMLRHRGIKYSPWTTNSAAETDYHYLAGYPEFTTNYPHASDKYIRRIDISLTADGTLRATRVNYDGTTEDITDKVEFVKLEGNVALNGGKVTGNGSFAVRIKTTPPTFNKTSYYIYSTALTK